MFRIGKLLAMSMLFVLCGFDDTRFCPRIDRIAPDSGPEGTRVTIVGKNLEDTAAVLFGKYESTFKIVSAGKLIAIAPRWVSTSPVVVKTLNGSGTSRFDFVVKNDPRIPADVGWKAGYVNPVRPPSEFKAALLWGIAIADSRNPAAEIQVARLRLSCRADRKDFALNDDEGDVRGGLYRRDPWFATDEHSPMPAEKNAADRVVTMRVGTVPDRVWHFWSASPRAALPPGKLEGCTAKARIKISQGALVQIGIDYWRSTTALWAGPDVNNHEAGVSDWYFASDQWQEITFTDIGGPQF